MRDLDNAELLCQDCHAPLFRWFLTRIDWKRNLKENNMREDYTLPICTNCYAVRVEPQRRHLLRPTCADCGEALSRKVRHTIAPLNKSNYVLITDTSLLKQLNPKRTT